MNQRVYIGECDLGTGVFAREPIPRLSPIFFLTGKALGRDRMLAMGEEAGALIQIGPDTYVNPTTPARYINHSCTPNTGIRDDFCFVAIEEIAAGEELRFDYSTTMLERHWEMDCLCRSPRCRRTIRDFDLLPRGIRERYLELGIVQQFIIDQLERKRADAA